MSDLGEREPQPAGLTHERQQPQHVRIVVSVAGRRAPWRLEDPACFVQPERLAAEAAASRDLPDEQSVARHEREHSPYPKGQGQGDRKSTRLNSSHGYISYAVFCLKKKKYHYVTDTPACAYAALRHSEH